MSMIYYKKVDEQDSEFKPIEVATTTPTIISEQPTSNWSENWGANAPITLDAESKFLAIAYRELICRLKLPRKLKKKFKKVVYKKALDILSLYRHLGCRKLRIAYGYGQAMYIKIKRKDIRQ